VRRAGSGVAAPLSRLSFNQYAQVVPARQREGIVTEGSRLRKIRCSRRSVVRHVAVRRECPPYYDPNYRFKQGTEPKSRCY